MSVRAREPAAEGVATTAARLETVLRVGHDFQERPDATGVKANPASRQQSAPTVNISRQDMSKPTLSNPEFSETLSDMAAATDINKESLAKTVTTLLACVRVQEFEFLRNFYSEMVFCNLSDDEISELESEVAEFARTRDEKNYLGGTPTLMECVYFFADTLTLLAIRQLEDPCAIKEIVDSLTQDVRSAVLDRAAKIYMVASMAYPGNDCILHWKRAQTVIFASARLPWMNEEFEEVKEDASVATQQITSLLTTATAGGAEEVLESLPTRNQAAKTLCALYVVALGGSIAWNMPNTLRELDRAHTRLRCLEDQSCPQTPYEFADAIYRPYDQIRKLKTLTLGLYPFSASEEVKMAGIPYRLVRFREWVRTIEHANPRFYATRLKMESLVPVPVFIGLGLVALYLHVADKNELEKKLKNAKKRLKRRSEVDGLEDPVGRRSSRQSRSPVRSRR